MSTFLKAFCFSIISILFFSATALAAIDASATRAKSALTDPGLTNRTPDDPKVDPQAAPKVDLDADPAKGAYPESEGEGDLNGNPNDAPEVDLDADPAKGAYPESEGDLNGNPNDDPKVDPQRDADSGTDGDNVSILFRFDRDVIDPEFMDNRRTLASLEEMLSDRDLVSRLASIEIMAAASPEGNPDYNRDLAWRRGWALKAYMVETCPELDPAIIVVRTVDRYWDGLVEAVEADAAVPGRNELLTTLTREDISDAEKNRRMNTMAGGRTFAYLRDNHILRRLRSGSADIAFILAKPEPTPPPAKPVPQPDMTPEPARDPIPEPAPQPTPAPQPETVTTYNTLLALKTNLLTDIVGVASLGVEVPIGKENKFSVAGSALYGSTSIKNSYALQAIEATLEARYWFNPHKGALTGWNLGLYGTYNDHFDVQWGSGWQGDGYRSVGIVGGWSAYLSPAFSLDLSVMAGWVNIPEMRKYSAPQQGHLMWERTVFNANRFLPTQARVSLIWLINKKHTTTLNK
ncbi:MAG: DUF3575 domain-containing protein [Alistipes sp.]|jgi:outer membrane protein OmpA-like peptidoglycan-associated protein|nr:DUF3575 domain-containing protein [Alistipes sp.]